MDHTFNMSSSVVDPMAKRQSQLGQKSGQDQTLAISELEGHIPGSEVIPLAMRMSSVTLKICPMRFSESIT